MGKYNSISEINISEDQIKERAKQLWHEYGCPSGRDVEIWNKAKKDLISEEWYKDPYTANGLFKDW